MAFENGVNWKPVSPERRGRHKTTGSALESGFKELMSGLASEKSRFFDSLADNWQRLFPDLPARPGRYEDGKIFIYVRNSATRFLVRPKLPMIAEKLATLPNAPKKIDLRLEQHVLQGGR